MKLMTFEEAGRRKETTVNVDNLLLVRDMTPDRTLLILVGGQELIVSGGYEEIRAQLFAGS